ncbi:ribosomal protein L34-domain-containing protein [Kalaharituber pfeilii]|nr:ribosomal protein L34-domain-containing protein [Kalaharituber pfeilii]
MFARATSALLRGAARATSHLPSTPSSGSSHLLLAVTYTPSNPISISARNLTILTPLRPTILSRLPTCTTFTPPTTLPTLPTPTAEGALDLLPRISTHPALRSLQVRNGPRDTYDPSHFVRKRRHGFLARVRSRTGQAILKRRRAKGRKSLSH